MAFTEKLLGRGQPIDTNNLTLVSAVASRTVVKAIRICNTTSSDATFRIFVVPNAGSAGVSNAVYYDINLPANQTTADDGYLVLETGDSIVVQAGTANSITFTISGATVA